MESSFKLGRIGGIEIGIHYTWLFAFFLVAWSLAQGFFPANYRGWDEATYWIVGIITALALFASVLVHELSHSFVAKARGIEVDSITLFIFGGVSNLKTESEEPKDEFLISAVGPLTSFALAGLFWLAHRVLTPGDSPLGASLAYLTTVNVLLGVFNLLPGFPLDGGRVLRAILWGTSGSMVKGTRWASYVGQAVAFLFIGWGVWQFFEGAFLNGLWIGFIGWFLNTAAEATRRQVVVQETFRGITVGRVMQANPPMVSPAMPVRELVEEYILRRGLRAFPVARDGAVVGLITLSDVKNLPVDQWDANSVGAIMTKPPLKTIGPREELRKALDMLVTEDVNQLVVVEDGAVLGLLSRGDVMRFLQMRHDLGLDR